MSFGVPRLLLLLLVLLPLIAALVARARWRRGVLRRLVGATETRTSTTRRLLKAALLLGGLALLAVAAAGPRRGARRVLLPREGTDVVIALDVSVSMLADDVAPNRFDRAKSVLSSLLDRLQGDRVGLVVFAGNATVRFPLTTDIAAARELIKSSVIKEGGLAAGTGIGDALRAATGAFPQEDTTRGKVVLVVSDGEDLAGAPLDAVRGARDRGMIVSTLGVGTDAGAAVRVPRPGGTPEARIDPGTGQPAVSRRDEGILRQIASAGRGRYYDGDADDPAAGIAEDIGRLARAKFESQEGSLPIERFQPFAAAALLLLGLDLLLPETVRRARATVRRGADRLRRRSGEAA